MATSLEMARSPVMVSCSLCRLISMGAWLKQAMLTA